MTELDQAYAECRAIAKREAKNFYYAFVALPQARRDAICAVYAFMRQADDIADDETISREQRKERLAAWVGEWKDYVKAASSHSSSDPKRRAAASTGQIATFCALKDAIARFHIPLDLLDKLIAGVAMDLDVETEGPQTYATFKDLYGYCYLVASVVGLICIRIFGYRDAGAEKLAEETGIAFQLTNILRDVAEDAERGRLYLPLDLTGAHGVPPDALLRHRMGQPPSPAERALLADIGERAEGYYASARKLLPMIDRESRPALWVLISIYHRLLLRIQRADYDVFSRRASVPKAQKVGILLLGQAQMALARGLSWG